jgi:hypothetical protein
MTLRNNFLRINPRNLARHSQKTKRGARIKLAPPYQRNRKKPPPPSNLLLRRPKRQKRQQSLLQKTHLRKSQPHPTSLQLREIPETNKAVAENKGTIQQTPAIPTKPTNDAHLPRTVRPHNANLAGKKVRRTRKTTTETSANIHPTRIWLYRRSFAVYQTQRIHYYLQHA